MAQKKGPLTNRTIATRWGVPPSCRGRSASTPLRRTGSTRSSPDGRPAWLTDLVNGDASRAAADARAVAGYPADRAGGRSSACRWALVLRPGVERAGADQAGAEQGDPLKLGVFGAHGKMVNGMAATWGIPGSIGLHHRVGGRGLADLDGASRNRSSTLAGRAQADGGRACRRGGWRVDTDVDVPGSLAVAGTRHQPGPGMCRSHWIAASPLKMQVRGFEFLWAITITRSLISSYGHLRTCLATEAGGRLQGCESRGCQRTRVLTRRPQ